MNNCLHVFVFYTRNGEKHAIFRLDLICVCTVHVFPHFQMLAEFITIWIIFFNSAFHTWVLWFVGIFWFCFSLKYDCTYVIIDMLVLVATQFMYAYSGCCNWLITAIIKAVTFMRTEIMSCVLIILEYWIRKGRTAQSWCKDDELKRLTKCKRMEMKKMRWTRSESVCESENYSLGN